MNRTRRSLLAAVGTASLAGCTSLTGDGGERGADGRDENSPDGGSNGPDDTVSDAPLPDDPSSHTYAGMGTGGPLVTYIGNWKCPYCAQFSTGDGEALGLGTIVRDYVSPGDLRLEYRAFSYRPNGDPFLGPDAPRAARAGLAVWNVDPESYWAFHERVMADQPPESDEWATTDRLVEFARDAGVANVDAVRTAVEDGEYEDAVRANTDAATRYRGFKGTPALAVDGTIYNPFDRQQTRDALDRLVES